MHHWTVDGGLTLAGDSWGEPSGPLVILQHGGGQTRHAWKGTGVTLAAAGYHAVAFDARGHGDSDWATDGDYTQDAMVDDLVAVIDAMGGQPSGARRRVDGWRDEPGRGRARDYIDATALVLVDIAPRIELEGVGEDPGLHEPGRGWLRDASGRRRRDRRLPAASPAAAATSTASPRTCASARTAATTGTGTRGSGPAPRHGGTPQAPRDLRTAARAAHAARARRTLRHPHRGRGARSSSACAPTPSTSTCRARPTWSPATATTSSATPCVDFLLRHVPIDGVPVHPARGARPHQADPEHVIHDVP